MNKKTSLRTKLKFCKLLFLNFAGSSREIQKLIPHEAVPLSKNITDTNNSSFSREATNEDILPIVNQVSPMESLDAYYILQKC